MYCAQCGIEGKASGKFCARCGRPLISREKPEVQSMHCPQCGKIYGADYQFCSEDGSQLQPQENIISSSPIPPPEVKTSQISKIVLLFFSPLLIAVLITGGYLYFSGRWMDIPVIAKLFTPPLTQKILENGEYYIQMYDRTVTLKERKFEGGSWNPGEENSYLSVGMEKYALGDLNADRIDDAAIILYSSGGGSGCFIELWAVINRGGKPKQIANISLGDRTEIKSLEIVAGKIAIDIDNPRFYPGQRKVVKYRLTGGKLIGPHPFRD
jgi:hypothetical protein